MTEPGRLPRFSDGLDVLLLLILLLRPTTDIRTVDRSVDLLLLAICCVLLSLNGFAVHGRLLRNLLVFTGLSILLMGATVAVNSLAGYAFSARDLFEFYRPAFSLLLLLVGAGMSSRHADAYVKVIVAVLAVQAVLMLLQFRNVGNIKGSILSRIYSMEKAAPHTGRTVGTYGNPNVLGFVIDMAFFALLLRTADRVRRLAALVPLVLLHAYLLVLSSSRTAIAAAGVLYVVLGVSLYRRRPDWRRQIVIVAVALASTVALASVWLVRVLGRYRYLAQTASDLLGGNVLGARGITLRLSHYSGIVQEIVARPFLGSGPRKEVFRVGDNDYLFSAYQWGLAGSLVKYVFYIYILAVLRRASRADWFARATRHSIYLLFLFGLTGESFYNYKYLSVILVNVGHCLGPAGGLERVRGPGRRAERVPRRRFGGGSIPCGTSV